MLLFVEFVYIIKMCSIDKKWYVVGKWILFLLFCIPEINWSHWLTPPACLSAKSQLKVKVFAIKTYFINKMYMMMQTPGVPSGSEIYYQRILITAKVNIFKTFSVKNKIILKYINTIFQKGVKLSVYIKNQKFRTLIFRTF